MKNILTIVLVAFISISLFGQDKILFMSGKELVDVKIDTLTGDFIRYFNQKGKDKYKDPSDIFSVTYAGEQEKVLYKKNLLLGDELTVSEARNYIAGTQYASKNYKAPIPMAFAFVSGFVGGNVGNLFFSPLPSLGTILFLGSFSTHSKNEPNGFLGWRNGFLRKVKAENNAMLDNENYVYGYKSKAKSKKIQQMAVSALAGIVLGYTAQQQGWVDMFKSPNAK